MSYKGFQEAQEKYDNESPPDFDEDESDPDSEDSSSCDSTEDDDIENYIDFLEESKCRAIERDYQNFLDRLFNTKEY